MENHRTFTEKKYAELKHWFESIGENEVCDVEKANMYFMYKRLAEFKAEIENGRQQAQ